MSYFVLRTAIHQRIQHFKIEIFWDAEPSIDPRFLDPDFTRGKRIQKVCDGLDQFEHLKSVLVTWVVTTWKMQLPDAVSDARPSVHMCRGILRLLVRFRDDRAETTIEVQDSGELVHGQYQA